MFTVRSAEFNWVREIKGSNLPVFTRRKHLNLGFRPSFKFSKTEALLLEEQKRELLNDIQPVTVWDRCVLSGHLLHTMLTMFNCLHVTGIAAKREKH